MAVAALHRRCALIAGAGLTVWCLGAPLLALLLAERFLGLPLLVRLAVIPLAIAWLAVAGWRRVLRPLLSRRSPAQAALLVEEKRADLQSRVVSALELYPELGNDRTPFDPAMLEATVLYAQESTRQDDFLQVVNRAAARRHGAAALLTVLVWAGVFAADPAGMAGACRRMAAAWGDVRDLARQMSGARIVIEPLERPAYLRGSSVTLRISQRGFHNAAMDLLLRDEGETEWRIEPLRVTADGRAVYAATNCLKSFECFGRAGRIESAPVAVTITERPRLVKLSVEYDLPAYAKRAPIVQPRSDGSLKALYGSSVLLTIEANKTLKSAAVKTSFRAEPEAFSVGGRFCQGVLRLELERWLKDEKPSREESYTIRLTDEYGYENEDADRVYPLVVVKDQGPEIEFVGLPHRSSAAEPHVLERDMAGVGLAVRAKDDYGITRITLGYRIESLETGAEKASNSKVFPMGLPKTDVQHLGMARLSQLGAQVGDRVVFWAETEDGFDMGAGTGPHKARTPNYRIAVVTEEQLFKDIVYRDDWSAHWYDGLKVAALGNRAPPPRLAPDAEPPAKITARPLDALPVSDAVGGSDRLIIQNYFDSLSGSE